MGFDHIPEIGTSSRSKTMIRLPEQIDVGVTARVSRLIDSPAFQRLKTVSQLGFVSWVYPGATHHRFEHSLGVYRLAVEFVRQLTQDPRFVESVTDHEIELLLVSALLHDIAHWPFCHTIEDIRLPEIPQHENLALERLETAEIAEALEQDWGILPSEVHALLTKQTETPGQKILSSILSGPIDVDKMDYLYRDSLHSGVPYGRNFDVPRLIGSLCLNQTGDQIAITSKGKTAAELMVFARYVMFSEVYWHHTVRSASAMFQRAFFLIREELASADLSTLFRCRENEIVGVMTVLDTEKKSSPLLEGLFGPTRCLYKRWAQFSFVENEELHAKIAGIPYEQLTQLALRIAASASRSLGIEILPHEVLLDAPPMGLEVQFDVDVIFVKENDSRKLGNVSPVVKTLASRQFDNYVKQVRLFVHPRIATAMKQLDAIAVLSDCLLG